MFPVSVVHCNCVCLNGVSLRMYRETDVSRNARVNQQQTVNILTYIHPNNNYLRSTTLLDRVVMCAARLIICKNAAVFTYHFLLQRNAGILTLGVRFILQSKFMRFRCSSTPLTPFWKISILISFHPVQKDFGKSSWEQVNSGFPCPLYS